MDEVHDHDTAVLYRDLEDGIGGVRPGGPATAGECSEAIGLREVLESDSSHVSRVTNSSDSLVGVSSHACARAARAVVASASLSCSRVSSSALSAAVGARAVVTPTRDARDSVVSGLVARAKVHQLQLGCLSQGSCGEEAYQRGRVSGPAEDLRPVTEVEAGVKFSAGRQSAGAGCCAVSKVATRTRFQEVSWRSAATTSLHPEVPDTQFVSHGRGLGIRQSMGWTKVCSTASFGNLGAKG